MKHYYQRTLLSLLLLFSFQGYSQQAIPVSKLSSDWSLIQSEKGINFYAKLALAEVYEGKEPLQFALIKLENTTSKKATLIYNLASYFAEGCVNCGDSQEARKSIEIPAGETVVGSTDSGNCPTSTLLFNPHNKMSWKPQAIAVEKLILNFE